MDPIFNTAEAAAASAGLPSAAPPFPEKTRTPLGALLVAAGCLDEVRLADALDVGSQTGERLGEVVVRLGLASEEDIARLLAEQWDLSYVDRASIWFDADALARLSREDAQRLEAMPTRVQDGRVVVAVAEPTELRLAALRDVIGEDPVVVVVPKTALQAGLHSELLTSSRSAGATNNHQPTKQETIEDEPAEHLGEDPPAEPTELPHAIQETASLAQSLAQLIEAQIGTARETSAHDAQRLAALEQRVVALEAELGNNRVVLVELGRHVQAIAGLLGRL